MSLILQNVQSRMLRHKNVLIIILVPGVSDEDEVIGLAVKPVVPEATLSVARNVDQVCVAKVF